MPRPYMSLSAERLEAEFTKAGGDRQVLATLKHELEHRQTRAARALLEKVVAALDGGTSPTRTPAAPRASPSTRRGPAPAAPTPMDRSKQVAVQPVEPPDYELLRASFTTEAELLARWGMTSSLPDDLMSMVFDGWCSRLKDLPDQFQRTVDAARKDREKIQRLRHAVGDAMPAPKKRRR